MFAVKNAELIQFFDVGQPAESNQLATQLRYHTFLFRAEERPMYHNDPEYSWSLMPCKAKIDPFMESLNTAYKIPTLWLSVNMVLYSPPSLAQQPMMQE
jgi:hypothetical protein